MSKSKKGFICWFTKYEKTSSDKGMAGWLIKKGIAKNKFTANAELVFVSMVFFAMTPLVFVVI